MATQTETSSKTSLTAKGKVADLNQNSYLDKWQQPTPENEYQNAIRLIEKRLDKMLPVNALFSLNMGPNHPDIVVDARGPEKPSMKLITEDKSADSLDCKVFIKPIMVQRFVDGLMEARYALNY